MSDDTPDYNLKAIRELLLEAFTAEDLNRFCLDDPRFRPISHRFGPGQGLAHMVDEVVDFCRTRGLWNELLAAVRQERPKVYGRVQLRSVLYPGRDLGEEEIDHRVRSGLRQLQVLRSEQLIDDSLVLEYQRRLLDRLVEF